MRKFLVKTFVLGTYFRAFNRTWIMLRASQVLFPSFCFVGSVLTFYDPTSYKLEWFDIVLLAILGVLIWIGFGLWNWGYFRLFPFKVSELDDEQYFQYLTMRREGLIKENGFFNTILSEQEALDRARLEKTFKEEYEGKRFYKLSKLIPSLIGVGIVIVGYLLSLI